LDVCEEYQKEQKLARLLEEIGAGGGAKVLVFTETKRKCDELSRTGHKGNTGTSYTLFTPKNSPKARDLVAVLTEAKQVKALESCRDKSYLLDGENILRRW
jgi:superfamily II DNA/RNA helicase